MKRKKVTAIELLRVISMLMIIAYHWELHANGDSIWQSPFSVNQAFSFLIGSWGTAGVNIFFMISAYFLIHSEQMNFKKLCNLMIKVSVYGTGVVLLANLFNIVPFSLSVTVQAVLGVLAYQYWFLTVYVILYIIHPCLNKVIEKISLRYFVFVLTALLYAVYVLTFVYGNELMGRAACGICIYLLIGFFEKYPQYNIFKRFGVIGSVVSIAGILGLEIALSYLGNTYHPLFFSCIRRLQTTQSPLMLIAALFLFYAVKDCSMKDSRTVLFLGKYSVGAYLIHGGAAFIKDYLWDGLLRAGYYYESGTGTYIFHYVLSVLLIFGIGVLCEFIYTNSIEKWLTKHIKIQNLKEEAFL